MSDTADGEGTRALRYLEGEVSVGIGDAAYIRIVGTHDTRSDERLLVHRGEHGTSDRDLLLLCPRYSYC